MSNQAERALIGEVLFREFDAYVEQLVLRGVPWEEEWANSRPALLELRHEFARFRLAREMAGIVGVVLSDAEMTRQLKERHGYRAMFPGGPPSLTGS
ncbi:hypothetical protein ABT024_05210 [Streptomyces sp. NPDC002812]|uniref:hypothetical protein n=1 Tax=Streptomyces sp. NPDC002812 TaxID=3154434 RepID=UPI0033269D54